MSTQVQKPVGEPTEWAVSRPDKPEERRAERRASRSGSSWIGGVALIVVGGLFLLQNAGVMIPTQQVWGFICYLGAAVLAVTAFARYGAAGWRLRSAVTSAATGALMLAFVGTMLAFDLSWNMWWPLLLIIPGAMAVIGAVGARSSDEP